MTVAPCFWKGRRVFLSGHTGFKGSWLTLWLSQLGAEVRGYALEAPTQPSLFEEAHVDSVVSSVIADVRDATTLERELKAFRPEVVIHMAAQPLVRRSYADPSGTYATNVMGTVNLLEAARKADTVRAIVNVTTDKVYANLGLRRGYREGDRLGGADPYSSGKACAELVTSSYRRSFFSGGPTCRHPVGVATARSGNVIGGGDWARDRLVPDIVRAYTAGTSVPVRNPGAIRPWQHVLEPLHGYLLLAEHLFHDDGSAPGAWNFGPSARQSKPVSWLVQEFSQHWTPNPGWRRDDGEHPHEEQRLTLASTQARRELGWRSLLSARKAVEWTALWYLARRDGEPVAERSLDQIRRYQHLLRKRGART